MSSGSMLGKLLLIGGLIFGGILAFGQTDSTLYVRQFPGSDVGARVTKAMAACNPDSSIPCLLVIDPSLARHAAGTLPALCSNCFLIDYRNGYPASVTAAGLSRSVPVASPAHGVPPALSSGTLVIVTDGRTASDCTVGGGTFTNPCEVTPTGLSIIGGTTNASINVQASPYYARCDGSTDDTTALQAAVSAADATGALLIFPANGNCKTTGTINFAGAVRWQGNNTTISISPTTMIQEAFAGSGISALDIGGFKFQGTNNTVAAFNVTGGTVQNVNFHDNTITGFTGCPVSPNSWLNAGIILSAAKHVKITKNQFLNGGCSSYWTTGGPSGAAVYNFTLPSYDWEISGNTVDNSFADFGFLLFDLFESSEHDNTIKDVVLGAGTDANSSGYGSAYYGTVICGGATLASPGGLSRTSNVVTFNFSGTCNPALIPGDHIQIIGSTSVGGTGFDDSYTIVSGGTTSATATADSWPSLANDTGGGGIPQYAPTLNVIHHNRYKNLAGIGIYLQGATDSTVGESTFSSVCQSMDDTSIPCGFVALNGARRVSVEGNTGRGSGKDGILSVNGFQVSVYGNNVSNVAHAGFRWRGAELSEQWFGNSSNGDINGLLVDGAAQGNVYLGNSSGGASSSHVGISSSSANFNIYAANQMNGGLVTGVNGINSLGGSNSMFVLNFGRSFRGNVFDLRTANPLAAFNYIYGGTGNGFSTGSASYALVTKNYLASQAVGVNDNSTGQSNVVSDNYFTGATTALSGINGMSKGNQIKGGSAGVFPVGSCTMTAGTCTITTAEVQAGDSSGKIACSRGNGGTNPGAPYIGTITAGTSFVLNSTNVSDTGTWTCEIKH